MTRISSGALTSVGSTHIAQFNVLLTGEQLIAALSEASSPEQLDYRGQSINAMMTKVDPGRRYQVHYIEF